MSEFEQNDETKQSTFLSEAPGFVRFFFDPARPIALRLGLGAVLVVLFFLPLFTAKESRHRPQQQASAPQKTEGERMPLHEEEGVEASASAKNAALPPPSEKGAPLEEDHSEDVTSAPPSSTLPASLSQASGVFPIPLGLYADPKGSVWATSIQDVFRFADGAIESSTQRLSPSMYEGLFNDEMPAFTASAIDPEGDLWLGSKNGQIMRYLHERYDWKISWKSNDPIREPIAALARLDNRLFIATSPGLWKWDLATGKLTRYKGFQKSKSVALLATRNGTLYYGSDSAVFRLVDAGWEQFFTLPGKQDGRGLKSLSEGASGELLVGTDKGFFRLSDKGVPIQRLLTSQVVTSVLALDDNSFLVGTEKGGLALYENRKWFARTAESGLPGSYVRSILRDGSGRIWLAITGKGVYSGAGAKVLEWLREAPLAEAEMDEFAPKKFTNACRAAASEMKKTASSGEVTAQVVDGRLMVFFRGRQVCPSGVGFRHGDGTIVTVQGSDLMRISGTSRETLTVPRDYPADQITQAFADSQGRIWLGLPTGPAVLTNGEWKDARSDAMFPPSSVQAFAEASDGAIWVGSSPTYSKDPASAIPPNLHRFDQSGWTHFSVSDGVPGWSVSALIALEDGRLAIATNTGLGFRLPDGKFVRAVSDKTGIPTTMALSEDPDGRLWLAHGYFAEGVSRVANSEIKTFGANEGLLVDRVADLAHDELGRHWLVSSNGSVIIYAPGYFDKPPAPAPADGGVPDAESSEKVN